MNTWECRIENISLKMRICDHYQSIIMSCGNERLGRAPNQRQLNCMQVTIFVFWGSEADPINKNQTCT